MTRFVFLAVLLAFSSILTSLTIAQPIDTQASIERRGFLTTLKNIPGAIGYKFPLLHGNARQVSLALLNATAIYGNQLREEWINELFADAPAG